MALAFLSTGATSIQTSAGNQIVDTGTQVVLPFTPNGVEWNYILNKVSFDTYGGRVTQLLSIKFDTMTIQGDAGSRTNLMTLFESIKRIQEVQIQSKLPLYLYIPNASPVPVDDTTNLGGTLNFYVWFQDIQVGFDPTTVTYPYILTFQVDDKGSTSVTGQTINGYAALSNSVTSSIVQNMFSNSPGANEIGYGNVGNTTLSAYYAGMVPISRYDSNTKTKVPTASEKVDRNTITGLGTGSPFTTGD